MVSILLSCVYIELWTPANYAAVCRPGSRLYAAVGGPGSRLCAAVGGPDSRLYAAVC